MHVAWSVQVDVPSQVGWPSQVTFGAMVAMAPAAITDRSLFGAAGFTDPACLTAYVFGWSISENRSTEVFRLC
ncbi:MAG: hypothetical protein HY304_03820 [candidate division Zixibacteria bacterium]|nr:hypothetical protein [candidate division Zixibacteria bacterium]